MHRTTFYEHYTDVHDLAASSACTEIFDQITSATSALPMDGASAKEITDWTLTETFTHAAEHRSLHRALLDPKSSARVIADSRALSAETWPRLIAVVTVPSA